MIIYFIPDKYMTAWGLFYSALKETNDIIVLTNNPEIAYLCSCVDIKFIFKDKDTSTLAKYALELNPKAIIIYNYFNEFVNVKPKIIQIFHGVIEKNWTYHHKTLYGYDAFFVPGEFGKNRLLEFNHPKNKIHKIGYPKMDGFFNGCYPKKLIAQELNLNSTKKIILYAPTHTWLSSEEYMFTILEEIITTHNVNLIIKLHDGSRLYKKYKEKFKGYPQVVMSKNNFNICRYFNLADILISDVSSCMFEYAVTGKPIISVFTKKTYSNFIDKCSVCLEKERKEQISYIVKENKEKLFDLLNYVLNGSFNSTKQLKAVKDVIELRDGNAGKRAIETINKII
ncbi:MAG: CDP-glycerol glycerophosphotransferase family protein [bacterium]